MSTSPLPNNVAVGDCLATARLPVAVNVPVAGSYNSALARYPVAPPSPSVTSTFPLGNNVAVVASATTFMLPVREKTTSRTVTCAVVEPPATLVTVSV